MATNTPVDIGRLIYSRPDLHSGRPCLAGTGMTVHAIVARYLDGLSVDDILDQFPHLDLSRVHAALAYYYANKRQIDADLACDEALYDELAAQYPNGWTAEPARI